MLIFIEEEECNMDQLWDLPTDFNFDMEEKRIKEKFIGKKVMVVMVTV